MITTQADRGKLIYLGMAHMLDLRPKTVTVGLDDKTTYAILEINKAAL
jgi:hypothetical protein